jgi:voltage-gated potassium channel
MQLFLCNNNRGKAESRCGRLTKENQGACMKRLPPKSVRRHFFVALGRGIRITWPVLWMILAIQIALGLLIGFVEGWPVGDALYFTFVTGLTIGYGDIVPRQALARVLAILVGISGLVLTGLIAGLAVYAVRTALTDDDIG